MTAHAPWSGRVPTHWEEKCCGSSSCTIYYSRVEFEFVQVNDGCRILIFVHHRVQGIQIALADEGNRKNSRLPRLLPVSCCEHVWIAKMQSVAKEIWTEWTASIGYLSTDDGAWRSPPRYKQIRTSSNTDDGAKIGNGIFNLKPKSYCPGAHSLALPMKHFRICTAINVPRSEILELSVCNCWWVAQVVCACAKKFSRQIEYIVAYLSAIMFFQL